MGYELIWQPLKNGWGVYSTVVCDFVAEGLKSEEEVANLILERNDYYKEVIEGKEFIAKAQFKSREEINSYFDRAIREAKDICWQTLEHERLKEECLPEEKVRQNLKNVYQSTLDRWDAGEIRPDPEAKEALRKEWIEEAQRIKQEGRLIIETLKCEITPEGLKVKGREIKGPEIW